MDKEVESFNELGYLTPRMQINNLIVLINYNIYCFIFTTFISLFL